MRMTKQKDGKCEFLVILLSYCPSLGCYWYTISQPCYLSHLQLGNSPPATIRILTNVSLEWITLVILKNSRWMNGLKQATKMSYVLSREANSLVLTSLSLEAKGSKTAANQFNFPQTNPVLEELNSKGFCV